MTSNTLLTSRSSRASATVFDERVGHHQKALRRQVLDLDRSAGRLLLVADRRNLEDGRLVVALRPVRRSPAAWSRASVSSSSSGVRPTITATPKRNSATRPCDPTRKASGRSEIVSGRSSPTVSIRSPTIRARAVRRVGASTIGITSLMRTKLRRRTAARQARGAHVRHLRRTGWAVRACQPARSSSGTSCSSSGQPTQR